MNRPKQRRPNDPAAERVADKLYETIVTCEEMFQNHGQGCRCEFCTDARAMVWALRCFHGVFDCQLVPHGLAYLDAVAKLRAEGLLPL